MSHRAFASIIADPWQDWDPFWLREISTHARWVAVRFTGLAVHDRINGLYSSDDIAIRTWEKAATRMVYGVTRKRRRTAYAVVQFSHYPDLANMIRRGRPFHQGLTLYEHWARTLGLSHRIDLMLRWLKAETHLPILVHVEDFSARWVLASGFRPDIWVMDNPIVSRDEAEELWAHQLSRPGYLRRSRWPKLRQWHLWSMHFPQSELLGGGEALFGRHGHWDRRCCNVTPVPITRRFVG